MPLKDWPPFSNKETYREWRERIKKENDEAWSTARWALLLIVIILLLNSVWGCAAWYEPSPELEYWKCIEATGSYVKCENLEILS